MEKVELSGKRNASHGWVVFLWSDGWILFLLLGAKQEQYIGLLLQEQKSKPVAGGFFSVYSTKKPAVRHFIGNEFARFLQVFCAERQNRVIIDKCRVLKWIVGIKWIFWRKWIVGIIWLRVRILNDRKLG